jgi:hypothetical protein
MAAKEHGTC